NAFVEGHRGERLRLGGAPHDAERINPPAAVRGDPLGPFARAERADGARVIVDLVARAAAFYEQLARARTVEERLILGIDRRRRNGHPRSRMRVAAPWREPSCPPVPFASASAQSFTCTAGCASPRSWRTASITLVIPPRFAGWLLHSPPPSVLNGSLPVPEIRLPSDTNLPPWPFSQKPRSSICIRTVIVKLS